MTPKKLITPISKVKPPNKKNTAEDPIDALMIGKTIKQNEELTQYKLVARGTTLDGIISVEYIQTTDPIVVLYNVMKIIRITKTTQKTAVDYLIKKNKIPSSTSQIPNPKLPATIIGLLPNILRATTPPKVVIN